MSEGKSGGIPHLAKNERDARISYTRHKTTAVCGFHRGKPREVHQRQQTSQEIRGVGHPTFVAGVAKDIVLRRAHVRLRFASLLGFECQAHLESERSTWLSLRP
jgi:hypothetical protein